MQCLPSFGNVQPGVWTTASDATVINATSNNNKYIFVLYTRPSTCGRCVTMYDKIVGTPKFTSWAQSKDLYLWMVSQDQPGYDAKWVKTNVKKKLFPGLDILPGIALADQYGDLVNQFSADRYLNRTAAIDMLIADIEAYMVVQTPTVDNPEPIVPTAEEPASMVVASSPTGYNVVTLVTAPTNVVEGTNATVLVRRNGNSTESLAITVLTNGFYCATLSWDAGVFAERRFSMPFPVDPEFSDMWVKKVQFKSLNRALRIVQNGAHEDISSLGTYPDNIVYSYDVVVNDILKKEDVTPNMYDANGISEVTVVADKWFVDHDDLLVAIQPYALSGSPQIKFKITTPGTNRLVVERNWARSGSCTIRKEGSVGGDEIREAHTNDCTEGEVYYLESSGVIKISTIKVL